MYQSHEDFAISKLPISLLKPVTKDFFIIPASTALPQTPESQSQHQFMKYVKIAMITNLQWQKLFTSVKQRFSKGRNSCRDKKLVLFLKKGEYLERTEY